MATPDNRKMEARFLAATLLIFGLLTFFVLEHFFYYMVGGLLLVFAFWPVHSRIHKAVKRPGAAAFLTFMIVIIVILGPLALVIYMVWDDAVEFSTDYQPDEMAELFQTFLDKVGVGGRVPVNGTFANATTNQTSPMGGSAPGSGPPGANATANATRPGPVATWVGDAIPALAKRVGSELAAVAPGLLVGLVVTGFVIFYGFAEGPVFYAWFRHILPLPDEIEDSLFGEIRKVTRVVFVGNILIAALSGLIGGLTFVIFGVPNGIFWGFVMFIFGLLPVLGAPMIWLPAAFWLFINGQVWQGVALLLINGVLVAGYIDNILRPRWMGRAANVHPILVLVGVLGGVEFFGALGLVIGPLVLAVFIAIIRSYTEWHPRWKERRVMGIERYHPSAEIELDLGTAKDKGPIVADSPLMPGTTRPPEPPESGKRE